MIDYPIPNHIANLLSINLISCLIFENVIKAFGITQLHYLLAIRFASTFQIVTALSVGFLC